MIHRVISNIVQGFIVLVIFALLFIIVWAQIENPSSNVSWGINGMTEERCIGGYKHVIGEGGQARQIMDEFGKGVKCH
jgi:hypothetical protein